MLLDLFKHNRNINKKNVGLQLVIIMALQICTGILGDSKAGGSDKKNHQDGLSFNKGDKSITCYLCGAYDNNKDCTKTVDANHYTITCYYTEADPWVCWTWFGGVGVLQKTLERFCIAKRHDEDWQPGVSCDTDLCNNISTMTDYSQYSENDCPKKFKVRSYEYMKCMGAVGKSKGSGRNIIFCHYCQHKPDNAVKGCKTRDKWTTEICRFDEREPAVCSRVSSNAKNVGVRNLRGCGNKAEVKKKYEKSELFTCTTDYCNAGEEGEGEDPNDKNTHGNDIDKNRNGVGRFSPNIRLLISLCLLCGFSLWISKITVSSSSNVGSIRIGPS